MRFMLYNIRYAAGTGAQFHLPVPFCGYLRPTIDRFDKIGDYIRSIRPDVVGLVEVDCGSYRSGRRNQAQDLARRIAHTPISGIKYARDSMVEKMPLVSCQGNAFLTNREIRSQRFHYLNNGMKRLVIELELAEVTLFLVHLSLKYRHRQQQLQELSEIVRATSKPAIVAGDFNVFRGHEELCHFLTDTGLVSANPAGMPSHPSRAPRRQLDYILHSPRIRAIDFQAPRVTFSDHLPLVCDFDLHPDRWLI